MRQAIYRRFRSGKYEIKEVDDPLAGQKVQRIVLKSTGQIVLKESERHDVISKLFVETKGEGARKVAPNLNEIYVAAGIKTIQRSLNKIREVEKLRPLFQNCAPQAHKSQSSPREKPS